MVQVHSLSDISIRRPRAVIVLPRSRGGRTGLLATAVGLTSTGTTSTTAAHIATALLSTTATPIGILSLAPFSLVLLIAATRRAHSGFLVVTGAVVTFA